MTLLHGSQISTYNGFRGQKLLTVEYFIFISYFKYMEGQFCFALSTSKTKVKRAIFNANAFAIGKKKTYWIFIPRSQGLYQIRYASFRLRFFLKYVIQWIEKNLYYVKWIHLKDSGTTHTINHTSQFIIWFIKLRWSVSKRRNNQIESVYA